MAYENYYSTGTVTVAAGATEVTGAGTAWATYGVAGGVLFLDGRAVPIASVEGEDALTLLFAWGGQDVSGGSYAIGLVDSEASTAIWANRQLAQITARAVGNTIATRYSYGIALSDRAAFDGEEAGFVFVLVEVGADPVLYIKESDANADWSGAKPWRGPPGQNGADGIPGNAADLSGAGAPTGGLGTDGQTYVDLVNGDTWKKVAGTWGKVGSIQGASPDLSFVFDNATTMADPGAGEFRLNHAAFASVTAAALSDVSGDAGAPNVAAYVTGWGDANNSDRGTLILRERNAHANFALFTVTGVADNSGWTQLALAHVASAGAFGNGDSVYVGFMRSGDNGNVLHSGAGAPAGGLGVNGDFYLDTSGLALYGPKAAGVWGSGASIIVVEYLVNIDGGRSDTVFAPTQNLSGGHADTVFP